MTKTWLITGAGRGMGVEFDAAEAVDGGDRRDLGAVRVGPVERGHQQVRVLAGGRGDGVGVAARGHDVVTESTEFRELSIDDYGEARALTNAFWASMNGQQTGDPAKLARALVELADSDEPPLRWVAGEDVVEGVEHKARLLLAQADAHRELSTSLAHDDAKAVA
jgi:hypothetical protein